MQRAFREANCKGNKTEISKVSNNRLVERSRYKLLAVVSLCILNPSRVYLILSVGNYFLVNTGIQLIYSVILKRLISCILPKPACIY